MPDTQIDRIAGLSTSLAVKAPCMARTTASITLMGLAPAGLSPAITLTGRANERVLVMAQTNSAQNGIYTPSTGSWTRTLDFDGPRDVVNGTLVICVSADSSQSTQWETVCSVPVQFGITPITFIPAFVQGSIFDSDFIDLGYVYESPDMNGIDLGLIGDSPVVGGVFGSTVLFWGSSTLRFGS